MSSSGSTPQSPDGQPIEYDPVFLNSRREAIVIFFIWFVAMLWAVPVSYIFGYVDVTDPGSFSTTWGIPTWLFWGILVPWIAADIVTTWFCFCYMKDDDIGEANEGANLAEEVAEFHASNDSQREGAGQ